MIVTPITLVHPLKEKAFLSNLVFSSRLIFFFYRPNIVYVASNHFVWRLVPVSIASQIRQLLQDKQFELALQLAVSSKTTYITIKPNYYIPEDSI